MRIANTTKPLCAPNLAPEPVKLRFAGHHPSLYRALHRQSSRAPTLRCRVAERSDSMASAAAPSGAPPAKVPLKVAVFSSSEYVVDFMQQPLCDAFTEVQFFEVRLSKSVAVLARGFDAVCLFVNDDGSAEVIEALAEGGVKVVAMRCAGFDRIDLPAAAKHGIRVVRVPAYSPRAVAEMALTMIMAAARNLRTAQLKVAMGNYALDGLVGMQVSHKTYGIVGTGKIGLELVKLLRGFEGRVLAYDVYQSEEAKALGVQYVDLDTLLKESDVVSLHAPLMPSTTHMINREKLLLLKKDAILINVSRGGLIDTNDLLEVLQQGGDHDAATGGTLQAVALDVYEGEDSLFFEDWSRLQASKRMRAWDNRFTVLKSMPQVLITPHIAFLTREALASIAATTVDNLRAVAAGKEALDNEVKAK